MKSENELLTFEDVESDTLIGIPKEERKIITQAYDKSVVDIIRMMEDNDIRLDPEYQRNYVWDNKKASLLIESLILNVPIPVIYVSQEEDGVWTVIDGLQRLYSLKRFFEGNFKLTGLEVLSDLNKCDINTLDAKAARILRNGLLRVIMISSDSNEEIKYDIFMRLNTGSVHLTEQELRNCLYRGSFNDLLKDLSQNPIWLSLLGLRGPHKRMVDRELELRFFALINSWKREENVIEGYSGKMKSFLNTFMKTNRQLSMATSQQWQKQFEDTVDKVNSIFGESAFKRIRQDNMAEKSVNRAIMDVLMLSVNFYSKEVLLRNAIRIEREFKDLIQNNSDFRDSLQKGTSDTKVLIYRLQTWCDCLDNILNA